MNLSTDELQRLQQMADKKIAFAINKLADYYSSYDTQTKAVRDADKAKELYLEAAELGSSQAMYNLGVYYEHNPDNMNQEKAMEWYHKAAENYNLDAIFSLASHHHWVVDGDREKAHDWFQTAAAFGHPEAMDYLVDYYEDDPDLAQSFAIRSFFTYKNLSEKGDVEATKRLAEKLKYGSNVEKDVAKAVEHYEIAYHQGDKEAAMYIAELYHTGEMGDDAYHHAAHWYEKAINDGNVRALYSLANMHHHGDGIPEDREKSHFWFQKAKLAYEKLAEEDTEYLFRLGYMYAHGYGVEASDERALFLFTQGAQKQDPDCTHWLATFYEEGRGGLEIDKKLGAELHEKANDLY